MTFTIRLLGGPLGGMTVLADTLDENRVINLPDERKLYVYERESELDYRFNAEVTEAWNARYDKAVGILIDRGFNFTPCELVRDEGTDDCKDDDE
jgi:hypothetical protein